MIGKIVGALAGSQAAKYTRSIGGPAGAALGFIAVPIVSRLRIPALLALGAGGYAMKKLIDKDKAAKNPKTPPPSDKPRS